jgi:predicted enzyme related to lactoylglutathione lyase
VGSASAAHQMIDCPDLARCGQLIPESACKVRQPNGRRRLVTQTDGDALVRKIDCVQIPVPDLDLGLAFYRDRLGHTLSWRTPTQAGLRLGETDAEIVLQTERPEMEANFLVRSVELAVEAIAGAGGHVLVAPFDIQIGRCAVVSDPWGNHLVLLDMSKGVLVTDAAGNVVGNAST